jgi:hypothetical protein
MNLEDLKSEIVSHLAEMSNLKVGEGIETSRWVYDHTTGTGQQELQQTNWNIYEDENKAQNSDWIEKEATGDVLGVVTLEGTKLYFKPEYHSHLNDQPEQMLLGDIVAPDSFEKAIEVLSHALKVLNVCKPPKGSGQFGSMTPFPGMPPIPFPGM